MTKPQAGTDSAGGRPSGPGPSDRSLLRRVQGGCQDAAAQLYRKYARRVHALARAQCSPRLARKVEVDDLVQSIFCTFFHKAAQGYYEVPDGDELWGLFLVIALHKIRNKAAYYSAAKRNAKLTGTAADLEGAAAGKSAAEFAESFLRLVIAELTEDFPPAHREMVDLRIQGYHVDEIAARTKRSKRTVERFLQDFRKKLEAVLRDD